MCDSVSQTFILVSTSMLSFICKSSGAKLSGFLLPLVHPEISSNQFAHCALQHTVRIQPLRNSTPVLTTSQREMPVARHLPSQSTYIKFVDLQVEIKVEFVWMWTQVHWGNLAALFQVNPVVDEILREHAAGQQEFVIRFKC